jgi:ABC-type branched-subunit amino acid transport system substrate-binding protein
MNPKFNYVFRTVSMLWNNIGLTAACADVAKEKGCKTVVLINPDDETGRANSANMKQTYQKLGLTIVDELFWKRDVTDYSPFATKIKSINPDYVDTGATPSGAPTVLLATALYESGYRGLVFYQGLAGTWKDIISKVGPKAIEGAIGGAKDPRDYITDPTILKLCDAYEKKYGVWETDSCYIMGGWFFFVEAVKKANSLDPDAIATAMQNLEVMTLGGKSRMIARPDLGITRTVDSVRQNALGMVKDGKFQLHKLISIDATIAATIKVMGWEQYYK